MAKGKSVELSTYLKWDTAITNCFRIKEDYDHVVNKAYVTHIYCDVFSRNSDAIKSHPSCHGKAKKDIDR